MKRGIVWLAAIALPGLLAVGAPARAQNAAPPPVVGVITALAQPVYSQQTYVGRIQATNIVQLNARVTGFLESQNFKDGEEVKQGQLLYVIEQAPYQAAVAQAQAQLEQAEAQARNANITLARAQALLRTPAGQQSTVDAAEATALSDKAQIDVAKAQLQTAQINLSYTEIRSPLDGQISATSVNVGNVVGPTSGTLATIVSQDPTYVTFALPVVDALKFRANAASQGGIAGIDLLLQLPDGRMYSQTGKIDFINNQITQNTDTLNWRGTIANPVLPGSQQVQGAAHELTSGEFVTVILRNRTPQSQIVVPRDAVITDQLGDYVLKIDAQNKAVRQPVTMGATTNTTAQIISGVTAGDKIVVSGIQRIHPGIIVTPKAAS
ncbi:MAG: efflux transporter periplasmic adaptor subunit [Acidocella sp. 20-57-95]|nr:MAG: efflux transporter periplasmic adaptor subunit [Acidocella sp. 20-57-95]OYV58769.1 MAG: efflux transporter periplasmic adaptor subunit [Acidocella sp. 21-58-7]HQT65033.1 efflux RND transporter periplasmic adaptor subunit [Acidocella sp.]HQU03922.1 efflux RND transporter periplasmic adaptor subunit [Acidocella sp.]